MEIGGVPERTVFEEDVETHPISDVVKQRGEGGRERKQSPLTRSRDKAHDPVDLDDQSAHTPTCVQRNKDDEKGIRASGSNGCDFGNEITEYIGSR